jgi:hypothetical protein
LKRRKVRILGTILGIIFGDSFGNNLGVKEAGEDKGDQLFLMKFWIKVILIPDKNSCERQNIC